ncbi:MAG: tetratricopeptide repeat protein [Pseudonocardia sp.]|nr:tetratricopeptide repeat protein [Pseudonocardia sp.]
MALTNLGLCYSGVGRCADAVRPTEEAVALRREQAAENPAYAPNLAMALTNLGVCYREVGRRVDAVRPSEDAVALYRDLAADNPAHAPDLAGALTNLGVCYREVGRRVDAVRPTEDAVALYREQAADNPAHAPDLAVALTNLDRHLLAIGDVAGADALWQRILGELGLSTRPMLLLSRASAADTGDPRAAGWLVEVCRGDDRGLLAAAHDIARTHRAANPKSWDGAWPAVRSHPVGSLSMPISSPWPQRGSTHPATPLSATISPPTRSCLTPMPTPRSMTPCLVWTRTARTATGGFGLTLEPRAWRPPTVPCCYCCWRTSSRPRTRPRSGIC